MLLTLTFFNFEEYPKTTSLCVMLSSKQLTTICQMKTLKEHLALLLWKMSYIILHHLPWWLYII